MPKYGDDQCVQCGGIRVAKSTLCADCLVKQLDRVWLKVWALRSIIDKRDLEIAISREQIEDALAYGFKKNQENVRLQTKNDELWRQINRRVKNEKDGISKH